MIIDASRSSEPAIPAAFFDPETLRARADAEGAAYRAAQPFPHAVLDGFAEDEHLDQVLAEFPPMPEATRGVLEERKHAVADETRFGPFTRHYVAQFNSSVVLDFLESLTGISGLIPDPHYLGGGLHQTAAGGYLKVHADFNRHKRLRLERRLNLILYLNRGWDEDYGGHLELWNRDMTSCEQRIAPEFNRCVIFTTTDTSYHGHPDPLRCPPGVTRKSIALYYYTGGQGAEEVDSGTHTTLFRARPGEVLRRPPAYTGKLLARKVLPPFVFDLARAVQAKRGRGGRRG